MYAQFIVWLGNGVIALLLLEPHRAPVESQPPWSHAKSFDPRKCRRLIADPPRAIV